MTIATGERLLATDITDLTFFPRGTILTFSTEAYSATSAEFKSIWKICNAANHAANATIPDLTNKFLRGADSSGTTGGADSVTLVKENLPQHTHTLTDPGHKHGATMEHLESSSGFFTYGGGGSRATYYTEEATTGISINDTFPYQTEYARSFSVVPSYYAVVYIIKVA